MSPTSLWVGINLVICLRSRGLGSSPNIRLLVKMACRLVNLIVTLKLNGFCQLFYNLLRLLELRNSTLNKLQLGFLEFVNQIFTFQLLFKRTLSFRPFLVFQLIIP